MMKWIIITCSTMLHNLYNYTILSWNTEYDNNNWIKPIYNASEATDVTYYEGWKKPILHITPRYHTEK